MACDQDIYVDHEQQIVEADCRNRGCLHDWSMLIQRTIVVSKAERMSVCDLVLNCGYRLCLLATKIV